MNKKKDELDGIEAASENAVAQGNKLDVQVIRGNSSVLSVRIPRQLLKELTIAAQERGLSPAALARQAIQETVAQSDIGTSARLALMSSLVPLMEMDIEKIRSHKAS